MNDGVLKAEGLGLRFGGWRRQQATCLVVRLCEDGRQRWRSRPRQGGSGRWRRRAGYTGRGPGPGPGVGRGVERGRTGTRRRRCLGVVHADVHMHRAAALPAHTGMRRSLQCTGTGLTRAGAVRVRMGTVDVGSGPGWEGRAEARACGGRADTRPGVPARADLCGGVDGAPTAPGPRSSSGTEVRAHDTRQRLRGCRNGFAGISWFAAGVGYSSQSASGQRTRRAFMFMVAWFVKRGMAGGAGGWCREGWEERGSQTNLGLRLEFVAEVRRAVGKGSARPNMVKGRRRKVSSEYLHIPLLEPSGWRMIRHHLPRPQFAVPAALPCALHLSSLGST
ncbi:hypothetical protein B0H14DRAFT_2573474 [Mycena olivaceomarginata]|nr:hypothetical protein B0H14DRAFT_2573474 [Mycena olivaceomarginata]